MIKTPEGQARKLEAASIIAAGPPAGSEISRGAQGRFFVCPRRRSTCENLECKVASACLAMREIGLDGNGALLRRRERLYAI